MCDYFLQRMDGDQAGGGDLTDIVRAGGGGGAMAMPAAGGSAAEVPSTAADHWQLHEEPMLFPPPPSSSSDACAVGGASGADVVFGADPFAGLGDPFCSDYSTGADFLDAMPDAMAKVGFDTAVGAGSGGCGGGGQMLDMSRKPLLPRGVPMPPVGVLQAPRVLPSPLSPRAIRPYPALAGDMVKLGITAGQVAGCAIDAAVVGMQMSSPRAAGGIKRRSGRSAWIHHISAPLHLACLVYKQRHIYTALFAISLICRESSAISFLLLLFAFSSFCAPRTADFAVCTSDPWKNSKKKRGDSKDSSGRARNWQDCKCCLQLENLGVRVIINTWCV